MTRLRHFARLGRDLSSYALQHRQWWVIVVVAALGAAVVVISVGSAAAPYTLYTLF